MIGQRLATAVARYRPRLISVDVFDTLLLRTTRPEFVRFADVATLQDRALRAGGHPSPGMARLLATRLSITRQAYQETRLPNAARGEVNFRVILADLCAELGLPSSFVADFLMIELEYEATVLSLNRPLLAALAQQTVPIIATSDTPLWSQDIAALLYRLAPNHPINRIFASGEVGLTKRRGGLYAHLASEVGTRTHYFPGP